MAKIWPFIAKTWSSHGPQNWILVNLIQSAQACSMPNFTIIVYTVAPSHGKGQNIALLWTKHGPHMILKSRSS